MGKLFITTERFITGSQITWLAAYGVFLHVNYPHLQLICLGCSRLKRHFLHVAQACKMTTFVKSFTLELPFRTLETFYMLWISMLVTSIFSWMCLIRIKFLLIGWHLLFVLTWIHLWLLILTWMIVVSTWFCLVGGLFCDVS